MGQRVGGWRIAALEVGGQRTIWDFGFGIETKVSGVVALLRREY